MNLFTKRANKNTGKHVANDVNDSDANCERKNLPSEQDRKTTVGCLAAVLTIMFEHQFYQHQPVMQQPSVKSKKGLALSSSSSSSKGKGSTTTGSSGDGGGNEDSSVVVGVSSQRTREFQKELLLMSTELLFLDPDIHAIEFLPILNNHDGKFQCEDDTDTTGVAASSSVEKLLLHPFISSFSNAQAGFDCISLLLFRFLLLSNNNDYDKNGGDDGENKKESLSFSRKPKTIIGYDSRVRYAFKYLSVSILKFWDPIYGKVGGNSAINNTSAVVGTKYATRKFETLEDAITYRISIISKQIIIENAKNEMQEKTASSNTTTMTTKTIKKKNKIIRGMKIGSAAIGAGALIAITGGIAIPAIIGGIATVAGVSAISCGALVAISLLIGPAAVTIFGVGSGLLVASKMNNRTRGLTKFNITAADDNVKKNKKDDHPQDQEQERHLKLSRTVCINGWIADEHDFERPFGMQPKSLLHGDHNNKNKSELLKRYCSVYAPQVIPNCDDILKEWKNKEDELWDMLRDAYGKDPNSLYPLDNGNNNDDHISIENTILTMDESESINIMMGNIMRIQPKMLQVLKEGKKTNINKNRKNHRTLHPVSLLDDVLNATKKNIKNNTGKNGYKSLKSSRQLKQRSDNDDDYNHKIDDDYDVLKDKNYSSYVAWDFQSTYKGMELYTVSWENDLLLQLRGSAKDLKKDVALKGVEQVMKKTILASLMTAVALPATLLGLTSLIDEKWTLANERADEAGILLAESLLMSTAGHRPVNLIGISFGSRMIISCLTELSRHQKKWEKQRRHKREQQYDSSSSKRGSSIILKAGDSIRKNISDSVTSKLGISSSGNDTNKSTTSAYLREPASIIENVVLMGCPASVNASTWESIRGVVAGRLINCYAGNDMMLALMYRIKNPTTALLNPPVGITEVKDCGVTNYDVSNIINNNHGEYCLVVRNILDLVGFDQP